MKNKKHAEQLLTLEQAAAVSESVKQAEALIDKKLSHVNSLMMGVIVVLFIGFVTMLMSLGALIWNVFYTQGSSYNELVYLIREQNQAIKELKNIPFPSTTPAKIDSQIDKAQSEPNQKK